MNGSNPGSSVRRILKRGGGGGGGPEISENLKRTKIRMKIVSPKLSPTFPVQNWVKTKRKRGLHSNLVQFFAQVKWSKGKNKQRSWPTLCVLKASAQLTKGGNHAAILHTILCLLYFTIYLQYTVLATQRGGPWPNGPPLNTPLNPGYYRIYKPKQN